MHILICEDVAVKLMISYRSQQKKVAYLLFLLGKKMLARLTRDAGRRGWPPGMVSPTFAYWWELPVDTSREVRLAFAIRVI